MIPVALFPQQRCGRKYSCAQFHQNQPSISLAMRLQLTLLWERTNKYMYHVPARFVSTQVNSSLTTTQKLGCFLWNLEQWRVSSPTLHRPIRRQLLISINWISLTKEMNPITRKSTSKFCNTAKFQSCWPKSRRMTENPENKRQMYGSGSTQHLSLIFWFFKCLPFHRHLAQSS